MLSSTDSGGNSSKLETTPAQNPPVGLGTLPLLASSIHGGDQLQPVCEAYHGEAGSLARFDKPQDAYPDAGLGHGALPDNAHARASLGGALPLVPEALPRVASSLAVSETVLQPGAEGIGIASSSAGLGGSPPECSDHPTSVEAVGNLSLLRSEGDEYEVPGDEDGGASEHESVASKCTSDMSSCFPPGFESWSYERKTAWLKTL